MTSAPLAAVSTSVESRQIALGGAVERSRRRAGRELLAPVVAAACAILVWSLGWQGTDVPTWAYRVTQFRSYGWMVWDVQWFGGHYVLPYSVLYPPLGATLGLYGAAALSAAAASWAFDRLLQSELGPRTTAAATLFAVGTVVPVAIGQFGFLSGEATGLLALLAARSRRPVLAALLAIGCGLFSPAAAAFLLLAFVAWGVASRARQRSMLLMLSAMTALPLALLGVAFPESGRFPFWGGEFVVVVAICAVGLVLVPSHLRALRAGLALYALAAVPLFFVANPLGGMHGRLAEGFSPALVVALATVYHRRWFALLAVPLLLWQVTPALAAVRAGTSDPSHTAAYFRPLLRYLDTQGITGRVEIPVTLDHWESAFVAPHVPLARGWERQLDVVDNPLFYRGHALVPAAYQAWLDNEGVRWVALPDVALDYSARSEEQLLDNAPGYLRPVWRSKHWRVWEVARSPGLVSGPAHLVSIAPDRFVVAATAPGTITIRVRYTPTWTISSGKACIAPDRHQWTTIRTRAAGLVEVSASLLRRNSTTDCDDRPS